MRLEAPKLINGVSNEANFINNGAGSRASAVKSSKPTRRILPRWALVWHRRLLWPADAVNALLSGVTK